MIENLITSKKMTMPSLNIIERMHLEDLFLLQKESELTLKNQIFGEPITDESERKAIEQLSDKEKKELSDVIKRRAKNSFFMDSYQKFKENYASRPPLRDFYFNYRRLYDRIIFDKIYLINFLTSFTIFSNSFFSFASTFNLTKSSVCDFLKLIHQSFPEIFTPSISKILP